MNPEYHNGVVDAPVKKKKKSKLEVVAQNPSKHILGHAKLTKESQEMAPTKKLKKRSLRQANFSEEVVMHEGALLKIKEKSKRGAARPQPPKVNSTAGNIPLVAPLKKKKKSKLGVAMQQLSEANSSNVNLTEELAKAQETIRALQSSLSSAQSETGDVNSVEFENDLGPSSTKHHTRPQDPTNELSRFVTSMNQISVSSISVPECKPSIEGEDISRLDFDAWQDLLTNSLMLAGITEEATQFAVFKVKAGQKLLEMYRSTVSSGDVPDEGIFPYSNAMSRLKMYFASTSDIMLQRRKLSLMMQHPKESDLVFIRRVATAARQCEYPDGKQLEEILSTVAEQARYKEVRIAALKMMSRKSSLADLIDKVREIETIRLNEEYVSKKHVTPDTTLAPVNAVKVEAGLSRFVANRATPAYARTPQQRINIRGGRGQRSARGGMVWRGSNSHVLERCTRCNSVYHSAERCFAINLKCHNCGDMGHLLRACNRPVAPRKQRFHDEGMPAKDPLEVAAVAAKQETMAEQVTTDKPVSEN
ncbi:uncharacterized protein LOC134208339 [Armigeres subalbatus]|uniref:uncharacterized protein LOC134208339 n=1 Tax=Armigeres subalbatus TaxID=124917 RepID=UPI002ED0CE97